MPTFVIHTLGQSSKKITLDKPPVRVGRDATNHIVLGDQTVSREHVVFGADLARRWYVQCVSDTNPIAVDGKPVTKRTYVSEGSEILVGKEHLIVFCAGEVTAAKHLGATIAASQCSSCGFRGIVRAGAPCPQCGRELVSTSAYTKQQALAEVKEGATSLLGPGQLGDFVSRLRAAKHSRLERTDGREPARKDLSEADSVELKLHGLVLGGGVTIAWDGTRYLATSSTWFPAMRVNGARTKQAPLEHGDEIRVGGNRFRFVTE